MNLAARIGTMAANGKNYERLMQTFRDYLASEEAVTLDFTGLFDEPTYINVGARDSGQIFRYSKAAEIIAPNFILNCAWICGSCDNLRSVRAHSVNTASSAFSLCPNLRDIYLDGMSSQRVISHPYKPWCRMTDPGDHDKVFHCNDGKKVVYDESTSAWVIADDVSVNGGGVNA